MAIYHFDLKNLNRTKRSSTAASAYINRKGITDVRTGITRDYSHKDGLLHSEIVGFDGDSSALWNKAELSEVKITSNTAREIIIALPHELDLFDQMNAARDFCKDLRKRYGVALEFALHTPDTHEKADWRNTHVHILFSTRGVDKCGRFGDKTTVLDNKKSGSVEFHWMRKRWQHIGNTYLMKNGFKPELDCRSLKDKGETREANKHLGPVKTAQLRKGELASIELAEIDQLQGMVNELDKMQKDSIKVMIGLEAQLTEHLINERKSSKPAARLTI